ncbi:MAG: hypothetical protein R2831_13535 [Chitinophagaceae bacterium]
MIRATAILAVGEDEDYLSNCLTHLIRQGLRFAVLDNSAGTMVRSTLDAPLFRQHLDCYRRIDRHPQFSLEEQLLAKDAIASSLSCDWVVHLDVDEIMHPFIEGETLLEGLGRVDEAGFNVVNFDEFVFLPLNVDYEPDSRAPQPIEHYYFFEPEPLRLMRAWKRNAGFSALSSGGHVLRGANLRVAPESMALRHYIFRNQAHAMSKYTTRRFATAELQRGWHRNRHGFQPEDFMFPPLSALERMGDVGSVALSRERPRRSHYWEWRSAQSHPDLSRVPQAT